MRGAHYRRFVDPTFCWTRICTALLLSAASLGAQTQTGTISGRVIGESSQPLVGAQVLARSTRFALGRTRPVGGAANRPSFHAV